MSFINAYQVATSVVFSMMTVLWVCSLVVRDASIVDRFWGAGFVLISWALALSVPEITVNMSILTFLVSVWGLRLSFYIHFRNRGHGEDYRYAEMRGQHGSRFWWYSFLSVFTLQGLLMLTVASPVIYAFSSPGAGNFSLASALGIWLWLAGFVMEAGGDYQLAKFKKDFANKGKLLTTGLWSLTRHPNYFGDALQWWGFGMFALAAGDLAGVLCLVGPLVMTGLIVKVSGVALLEKNLKVSKPGYEAYVAGTPAFLPKKSFWVVLGFGVFIIALIWRVALS